MEIEFIIFSGINKVADQVIDAFGNNLMFMPDKKEGHFTVNVLVDVSPPFFAWLSTFGNELKIVSPQEIRSEMKEFLEKSLRQYSR